MLSKIKERWITQTPSVQMNKKWTDCWQNTHTHTNTGFRSNTMSSLLSILHKTAHALEVGSPKPARNKHESDYVWQGLQQKILSPPKKPIICTWKSTGTFLAVTEQTFSRYTWLKIHVFRFRLNCTWKWLKTVVPLLYGQSERVHLSAYLFLWHFGAGGSRQTSFSNRWSIIYHHWATMFSFMPSIISWGLWWNEIALKQN